MDLRTSLIITTAVILLIFLMCYFGLKAHILSAFTLATLIGLIVLNTIFPFTNLADQISDNSLWIYASINVVGICVVFVYVIASVLINVNYGVKKGDTL